MPTLHVPTDPGFQAVLGAAVVRLGYLYPGVTFVTEGEATISATWDPPDAFEPEVLRRDILHAVYRERIYRETLPVREALYRSFSE